MPDGKLTSAMDALGGMTAPPDVALTFPANDAAVRRAMSTIRQGLRQHALSELSIGTLELVMAEACNNIVEHAYENSGRGVISLTARCLSGFVQFEISDTGKPMPGLAPPTKRKHDLNAALEQLPEGGFGWGLIRDMTTSLIYRRYGGRNILRLCVEVFPEDYDQRSRTGY